MVREFKGTHLLGLEVLLHQPRSQIYCHDSFLPCFLQQKLALSTSLHVVPCLHVLQSSGSQNQPCFAYYSSSPGTYTLAFKLTANNEIRLRDVASLDACHDGPAAYPTNQDSYWWSLLKLHRAVFCPALPYCIPFSPDVPYCWTSQHPELASQIQ